MNEFDFIRRYLQKQQHDAELLLGDGAAVIRPRMGFDLCFSGDMLLKENHFLPMFRRRIWLGKYWR